MEQFLRALAISLLILCACPSTASAVHMVLEQRNDGSSTHRAIDLSQIGDGIDPVLQFILMDEPADLGTVQILWVASEKPIRWNRTADEASYSFVEYAKLIPGSFIEYRVYSSRLGNELAELRHLRMAGDTDFSVDGEKINSLSDDAYELRAHLHVPNRPRKTLVQQIIVQDFDGDPDGEIIPESGANRPATPTLKPGNGWEQNTPRPAAVGSPQHPGFAYPAIAQWAVVPHQVFSDNFTIGTAAFHSYGIDRVDFSVNGGPWVSIDTMKLNPRTKASEYFVNLNAANFKDGKIVVRAIAYPKHGIPRVLEDLELFANASGTLQFPVIELDAGSHELTGLSALTPKENGWLTIRPKPGVAKEDCVITQIDRVSAGGNLKIQGLTITHDGGNDFLYGKDTGEGWVWLDDVKVVGNGRNNPTSWLVHLWGRQFYTDCEISEVSSVFHGGGGSLFARNVYIFDTYEDVFRAFGYAANISIDGVDRGDQNSHPDLFEFATGWKQSNIIFQNIRARDAFAQGIAGGNIEDLAIINCDVVTPGWSAMQIGRGLKNILIEDSRFLGGARFREADPDGVVIRNSELGWQLPYLPENWDQSGIKVIDHPHKIRR